MTPTPDCVPPTTLRRYLDESLPAADETAVAAHLGTCPACRAAVADILREPLPAGPPAPEGAPAVPGYDVLGVAGEGGMGVVYRARDRKLDREVAVKVIRTRLAAFADLARSFEAEARVMAALQEHPGIIPVTDFGELPDGRAYVVMKFVVGETFAARLAAPDRARGADADLRVVERIARIAGHAHTLPGGGVAHRDLKPSNVLLTRFDEVFVADWGLSKWYAAAPPDGGPTAGSVTAAGHGTWAYMPPEQAEPGPGRPIGAASDVFALGGLLVEVLTGAPTYTAATPAGVAARARAADLGETLARLAGCGADPDLIALARRCLAADPAARPADGAAVADELRAYFDGRDARVKAAEVRAAAEAGKAAGERKRRRWQVAAFAAALLAAAAVPVIQALWTAARQDRKDRDAAEAAQGRYREQVKKSIEDMNVGLVRLRQGNDATALRDVFDRLDRRVRDAAAEIGDSSELTELRAQSLVQLSEASLELGDSTRGVGYADEAVRLYDGLAAADPGNDGHQEGLAAACHQLGESLDVRWEDARRRANLDRAMEIRRALADRRPTDPDAQANAARSEGMAADDRSQCGDDRSALPLIRSALARRQAGFAARPTDPAARLGLANANRRLAETYDALAVADPYGVEGFPALSARHGAEANRLLTEVPAPPALARDWERGLAFLFRREMWAAGDTPAALRAMRELARLSASALVRNPGNYFWELRVLDAEVVRLQIDPDIPRAGTDPRRLAFFQSVWGPKAVEWLRTDPENRRWQAMRVVVAAETAMILARTEKPDEATAELDAVAATAESFLQPAAARTLGLDQFVRYILAREIVASARSDAAGADAAHRRGIQVRREFFARHAAREPANPVWRLQSADLDREESAWLFLRHRTAPGSREKGIALAAAAHVATRAICQAEPADYAAAAALDRQAELLVGWLTNNGRLDDAHHDIWTPPELIPDRAKAAIVTGDRIQHLGRLAAARPGNPVISDRLRAAQLVAVHHARIETVHELAARQNGKAPGPTPFRERFGESENHFLHLTDSWVAALEAAGPRLRPTDPGDFPSASEGYFATPVNAYGRQSLRLSERLLRVPGFDTPSRRGGLLDAHVDLLRRHAADPARAAERAWAAGRVVGLLAEWDERRVLDPYLTWWRPHLEAEWKAAPPRPAAGLSPEERALHATFRYPELARRLVAARRSGSLFALLQADWAAADGGNEEGWRAEVMGIVGLDALLEPGVGAALLAPAECWLDCAETPLPPAFRRHLAFAAAANDRPDLARRLDPTLGYRGAEFDAELFGCGLTAAAGRNWPRLRSLLGLVARAIPREKGPETEVWEYLACLLGYEDGDRGAAVRAARVLAPNPNHWAAGQRAFAEIESGGDLGFARLVVEGMRRRDPGDVVTRSWHAWLLGKEGKAAEGAALLRGMKDTYPCPQCAEFFEHLADLEAAAGETTAAEGSYRRALALFPTTAAATDRRIAGVRAKLAALGTKRP